MILLALAFSAVAFCYASVGFGGGSTYLALLVLVGVSVKLVPVIAPLCNVIVVLGGSIRFARAGLVPWKRVLPLVAASAPLAYLGGRTPMSERGFIALLAASLLVAGILLIVQPTPSEPKMRQHGARADAMLGGSIGYLSGLVGIGGGILLSPIQHLMRWGPTKQIAATAAIFILVNALSGLAGQLTKLGLAGLPTVAAFWPLLAAVLVGGQLGTHAGLRLFDQRLIRHATAVLVLFAAIQMLRRVFAG